MNKERNTLKIATKLNKLTEKKIYYLKILKNLMINKEN